MPNELPSAGLTGLRDNSALRRVGQLGSARDGLREWRLQRVTAIMLVPLGLYLVASVLHLATSPREEVSAWLGYPVNSLLMLLLVVGVALHAFVGLRSIFADYVHGKGTLLAANLLVRATMIVFAAAGCLAILEVFIREGRMR